MPLALAGVIFVITGLVFTSGRLPRNMAFGIVLPVTYRSDEAWRAAHRAGGPAIVAAGVAMLAGALAEPVWSPAPAVGGLLAVLAGFVTLVLAIRGQRDVP